MGIGGISSGASRQRDHRCALMNPRVRALGETVLRVKNLERVKRFYTDVIGLDVLPVNRFVSRRLRCTISRSRSTRATSTPSWLACRASEST